MQPLTLGFVLILAGLLLLLAELLVPSGIFFVLSLAGIVGGLTLTFIHGGDGGYTGWLSLLFVAVVVPATFGLVLRYWPRTPMGRRFFLQQASEEDATLASMPVNV